MKSWAVHYKNKYPGSKVSFSDSGLDVYSKDGEHLVAIRKNGSGQFEDKSEEHGCFEKHDLAPIPREARVHKLHKDGSMGLDEEAEERREKGKKFHKDEYGYKKVKSCDEYKKDGYEFDEKGNVSKEPKAKEPKAKEAPAPEAPAPEESPAQ